MSVENYTPHAIILNSGESYPSKGVARVGSSFSKFDEDGICSQVFGKVEGLPEPKEGTLYCVSSIVKNAASDRHDLVVPATGHPDCIRDAKGFIVSVPGFCR